jgi:hypothetical protein
MVQVKLCLFGSHFLPDKCDMVTLDSFRLQLHACVYERVYESVTSAK